ncbi:MAG: SDR family oxidoreductase [Clostridiales bacterium]|jgi:NAD(P)-dependent dehydrogenase (short-subunit alcohol dehydrogenase family)|nr:SDR family oxidoreductase [Clostridiales bacterium]
MKFDGKVVLITDAANPCGKAIAERFAREGAKLALNFPKGGQDAAFDLKEHLVAEADPANKQAVDALVESVAARFGKIDILIHSNNEIRRLSFEDCTDEQFIEDFGVNAKSAFLFTQAVGLKMQAAKSDASRILYISSIHDEKPTGAAFMYGISKGAVQMLAREAAIDLGVYGVRVNVISCGPVDGAADMFESDLSKQYENLTDRIPLRKVGGVEDFAALAMFLCGDEAKFISGEDIRVDGGFLLNYHTRMTYEEFDKMAADRAEANR